MKRVNETALWILMAFPIQTWASETPYHRLVRQYEAGAAPRSTDLKAYLTGRCFYSDDPHVAKGSLLHTRRIDSRNLLSVSLVDHGSNPPGEFDEISQDIKPLVDRMLNDQAENMTVVTRGAGEWTFEDGRNLINYALRRDPAGRVLMHVWREGLEVYCYYFRQVVWR